MIINDLIDFFKTYFLRCRETGKCYKQGQKLSILTLVKIVIRSEGLKKITKPHYNIKVAFGFILNFIKKKSSKYYN